MTDYISSQSQYPNNPNPNPNPNSNSKISHHSHEYSSSQQQQQQPSSSHHHQQQQQRPQQVSSSSQSSSTHEYDYHSDYKHLPKELVSLALSRQLSPNYLSRLQKQLEYYFSDHNLLHDIYMKGIMNKQNGYINIDYILQFPRMKELKANDELILSIAKLSPFLEINSDNNCIRNKSNWQHYLPTKDDLDEFEKRQQLQQLEKESKRARDKERKKKQIQIINRQI